MEKEDYKLVYVLKVGYDGRKNGIYEFMFSKNSSNIDKENLGWDEIPASGNAVPPENKDVDMVLTLTTDKIDFKCLHELDDRAYIDGFFNIHCLAFEDIDSDNSDIMYDETTLLVLHYGLTAKEVIDLFMSRDLLLKEVEIFKPIQSVVVSNNDDEEDEEDELGFEV